MNTMQAEATSLLDFVQVSGSHPETRYRPFADWIKGRQDNHTLPYRRVIAATVSDRVRLVNEDGTIVEKEYVNYSSQDYLGLVTHPRVSEAAADAVHRYGVHSSGSPALMGRTIPSLQLEERLSAAAGRERCVLFPTGWAAGFGVIAGLARRDDVILLDQLAHNCLQTGAMVSRNIHRFRHNDTAHVEQLLREVRAQSPDRGVFLIIESLYSMDSDTPDLRKMIDLAHEYDAIAIVDVAHDFGAIGEQGLGLLETVAYQADPDIIMGSFSKTFASNGGFVLSSPEIHTYLCYHSHPHLFSNALSPVQASAVLAATEIIFSPEGDSLRARLMDNVLALREAMVEQGFYVGGTPSAIVPVFVGDETVARITSGLLADRGLLANLAEYPVVPRGEARFRFQVMPSHSAADARQAARILAEAVAQAKAQHEQVSGNGGLHGSTI